MAYEIQGEESRGGEDTAEITYRSHSLLRSFLLLFSNPLLHQMEETPSDRRCPEPLWPPSRKANAGWVKLGSEERLKNGRLETEAHIHGEQEDLKVAQESFAAKS